MSQKQTDVLVLGATGQTIAALSQASKQQQTQMVSHVCRLHGSPGHTILEHAPAVSLGRLYVRHRWTLDLQASAVTKRSRHRPKACAAGRAGCAQRGEHRSRREDSQGGHQRRWPIPEMGKASHYVSSVPVYFQILFS
jgi:hypothetical protein